MHLHQRPHLHRESAVERDVYCLPRTPTSNINNEFASESDLEELDPDPGVVSCIEKSELDTETHLQGRSISVLMNQERNYAMYCRDGHEYHDLSWFIIFEPFDLFI